MIMNTFLVILKFLLSGLIILVLMIYVIKKLGPRIFSQKTVNLGSLLPKTISNGAKKTVVAVVVYLFLLLLIRELQPDIWNWVWEKDQLFWLIQATFISIALIFSLGPKWTKYLLFPALIIVLTTYILSEIGKDIAEIERKVAIEKGLIFKPLPYSDHELQNFLENSEAPQNLRKFEKRGRIKNLQKIFSGKVSAVEWSPAVTLTTPPSEKIMYKLETVVLSGQVMIKNYDSVVGKYPDKNFKSLKGKSFSLRFKSIDHLETGVVVWRWEEHLP